MLSPLQPFHFREAVGQLIAVVHSANELKMQTMPVRNQWWARSVVKEIEQRSDFHAWAVDPFTGAVNVHVQVPNMNE